MNENVDMQEASLLNRISASFGEDFVRYVLAIPDQTPLLNAIDEKRQPVLQVLLNSMQQALISSDGTVDMAFAASGAFASYRADLEGTLAQALRRASGGEVELAERHSDRLMDALQRIARDVWPALLIVPTGTKFPRAFSVGTLTGIHGHPSLLEACKAFMADPDLANLFPDAPSIEEKTSGSAVPAISADWVMTATGGGTRFLSLMPGAMIFHAALLAQQDGSTLTYHLLMQSLESAVEAFRALSRGETVEVPALIGLRGVSITGSEEYQFGSAATLRGVRKLERDLLLHNSESVNCVLETTMPVKIHKVLATGADDSEEFFKEFSRQAHKNESNLRTLEKRIDRVRLSLLLASDGEEQLATSVVSHYVLDLSHGGGGASWANDSMPHSVYELKHQVASNALELYQRILENHPDSLDVAQRRLLSAVSQRWDARDAFIDAVVAWENAFGVHSETTFRVTGSISKLLEPRDLAVRTELQAELKKLYEKRSRLVHGGNEPSVEEIWKLKDRAIHVAVLMLKELYENRTDLLPLSSAERGQRLLLEGL